MNPFNSFSLSFEFILKILKTILPIVLPYFMIRIYRFRVNQRLLKSNILKDKVVIITGASSGLGKALAKQFFSSGAQLILSSRNVDNLEEVKQWLINEHKSSDEYLEPRVLRLDLSQHNQMETYAKRALSLFGRIDIIINNGGISYRGTVVNTTIEVDRQLMDVNYFGQIALIKAFLPKMIERNSGQIVVISSVQGQLALPYRSAYTASKHALQAFCDSLRSELFATDISVCVISPGYIKTNLSANAITGSGQTYGLMDTTTATGMEPQIAAQYILECVVKKDKQLFLSPVLPKIAILIRFMFPNIYFYLMRKRAQKESNK